MSIDLSLRVIQDVIRAQPTQQEMTEQNRPDDVTNTKIRHIVATDGELARTEEDKNQKQQDQQYSSEDVMKNVAAEFAHKAQNISRDLEFTIDDELGKTIITVYDSESEEVVRQIPSEEVLALAKSLENNSGIIFKSSA